MVAFNHIMAHYIHTFVARVSSLPGKEEGQDKKNYALGKKRKGASVRCSHFTGTFVSIVRWITSVRVGGLSEGGRTG